MSDRSSALRLSFTLTGGASLGAFQAGAMAAFTTAAQASRRQVDGPKLIIDGIGGASAGAVVGLLSSLCLQRGVEATPTLHRGWVEVVSFELLRTSGPDSPLSFDEVRRLVADLFGDENTMDVWPRQQESICFLVALTGLRGLHYDIEVSRGRETIQGTTHTDWTPFLLTHEDDLDHLLEETGSSVLDVVLASAAHPAAFSPRSLDRSHLRDQYEANGIVDLPEDGVLWYGDGATLQAEPIGHVIAAAERHRQDDADRLHFLIDPRSADPKAAPSFSDPNCTPSWSETLARTMAILPEQAAYDDLRRLSKANHRLDELDRVLGILAPHLGDDVLDELAEGMEGTPHEKLESVLRGLGGLEGKRRVDVGLISPRTLLEDGSDEHTGHLLAGELLGDFGGFLERDLRHSDFCLGYDAAAAWMEKYLPGVLDGADGLMQAIDDARIAPWKTVNRGGAQLADLDLQGRLELAQLGRRYLRVMATDTWQGISK